MQVLSMMQYSGITIMIIIQNSVQKILTSFGKVTQNGTNFGLIAR